jgi:hypothetical protein
MFMEAMLGISNIAILISTSKNVFSFLLLLMSSLQQNLRKGQNRFCLEARVVVGRGKGWRAGEKNDQNNVCTYEYTNKSGKMSVIIKNLPRNKSPGTYGFAIAFCHIFKELIPILKPTRKDMAEMFANPQFMRPPSF